jgi:hypothetical protein
MPGPKKAIAVLTPESIKTRLASKGARAPDLAKEFGVSIEAVRKIVEDPANGFTTGLRGWIKLREETVQQNFRMVNESPNSE